MMQIRERSGRVTSPTRFHATVRHQGGPPAAEMGEVWGLPCQQTQAGSQASAPARRHRLSALVCGYALLALKP
jgi:hypothetical protein